MFLQDYKIEQTNFHKLLSDNTHLETLANCLANTYLNHKILICDFILFSLSNDLYREENGLALKAILLRYAHELSLCSYISVLWKFELKKTSLAGKALFKVFLKDPRMQEIWTLKIEELSEWLGKQILEAKVVETIDLISKEFADYHQLTLNFPLNTIRATGSEGLLIDQNFDHFAKAEDTIRRARELANSSITSLSLDFPLPMPSEVPITEDDYLIPFPYVLEAPLINPCLKYQSIVNDLFNEHMKLKEDQLSVD